VRRRTLGAVGVAAACAFVLVASCSFPDVAFSPNVGEGGGGETSTSDSPTTGEGGDGGTDGPNVPETGPPIDATSEKPDTGPCVDPCDCDKDGYKARDAGCGGDDCDDTDPRAHPGQNFLTDVATADTKGDWNCNGIPERLIQNVNVVCGGATGSCAGGKQGLAADIPCGTFGQYVVCKPGFPVGCNQADSGVAQQECR
jgi:hypothetical protein